MLQPVERPGDRSRQSGGDSDDDLCLRVFRDVDSARPGDSGRSGGDAVTDEDGHKRRNAFLN